LDVFIRTNLKSAKIETRVRDKYVLAHTVDMQTPGKAKTVQKKPPKMKSESSFNRDDNVAKC